jgi:hypothetical protein
MKSFPSWPASIPPQFQYRKHSFRETLRMRAEIAVTGAFLHSA